VTTSGAVPGSSAERAAQLRAGWSRVFTTLTAGQDLAAADAEWAMDQIMSGAATAAQIGGFAIALRAKGESPAEISGMAAAMLAHARQRVRVEGAAVDIVGTGADQAGTVNISTMAAVITAAAGTPVVKHGARASTSKSGAADVLEALGVTIEQPADVVARQVRELGIGFCLAPAYHPALRHAGPARRELAVPTAFNLLGPLTNPAQPEAALVGCANATMAPVLADVFAGRGTRVLLVRGDDGLDELTTTTTSTVWVVSDGQVRRDVVDPAALGVRPATPEDLKGGDPAFNAQVVRDLVGGKPGPVRDAVLLNAAGAVAAYRGFSGDLAADLRAGLAAVSTAIDSGAAASLLERWIAWP
jgi:anthranilate phosphoribosyltransferase